MATLFSPKVINKALTERPWIRKIAPNRYRVTPRTSDHGKYELEFSYDADGLPVIESCVDVRTKEPCLGFSFTENCYHGAALATLESGVTACGSQDGPTLDLFGQAVAPVRVFHPPVKAKGLKTLATSGLVGLASSASQDLQRSLENRLIRRLDSAGSTLFKQTWKRRVTPLGRRYLEHTASARRTSDNGFTSLPTPKSTEHQATQKRGNLTLNGAALLTSVPTPCRQDGPKGGPAQGVDRLPGAPSLASVATPRSTEAGHSTGNPDRAMDHKSRLEDQVFLSTVPTPMAGTPAQNGYNEAGSTDYARKIVNLASMATPKSSDCAGGRTTSTAGGGNAHLDKQAKLATVTTPTAQDHSRGNKPAGEWDTGVPLSQQAALATVSESGVDQDGSIRSPLAQLPRQAQLAATGPTATGGTAEMGSTGQLAPDYSRWLMGLPEGWASCADMVTRSSRHKRKHS